MSRWQHESVRDRVFKRLIPDDNGCLVFNGAKTNGYGMVRGDISPGQRHAKQFYVHRLMYEWFVGPIPDGKVIDHLCRNRACANVAHLEAVTQRDNILRGEGLPAKLAREPNHCEKGHEYTPENTLITVVRSCRECRRAYSRRKYARSKGR
jgi:hypothetical protein